MFTSRSLDAQKLLEVIASSGAAGSSDCGIALPSSTQFLQELIDAGCICKMSLMGRFDHDHYTLTQLGRSFFKPCFKIENPVALLKFKRTSVGTNMGLFTTAEMVLYLARHGWKDVQTTKTKTMQPYRLDGIKVWYKDPKQKINKLYLHALAVAADRFKSGCVKEICHFQPQAYYRAIVDDRKNVLPNQPLAFYKLLSGERDVIRGTAEEMSFDEPSLLPASGVQ